MWTSSNNGNSNVNNNDSISTLCFIDKRTISIIMYRWNLQLAMSTNLLWNAKSHLIWIRMQTENVFSIWLRFFDIFFNFVAIVVEFISYRNSNSIIRSFPSFCECIIIIALNRKETFYTINFIFQWKIVCCTFNMLMIQSDFPFGFLTIKMGCLSNNNPRSCIRYKMQNWNGFSLLCYAMRNMIDDSVVEIVDVIIIKRYHQQQFSFETISFCFWWWTIT